MDGTLRKYGIAFGSCVGAVPSGPGSSHQPPRHFHAGEANRTITSPFHGQHPARVTSGTDMGTTNVDICGMAHKYPNVLIHCVFSTKERRNLIPLEMLPRLWKYFAGIGRNH